MIAAWGTCNPETNLDLSDHQANNTIRWGQSYKGKVGKAILKSPSCGTWFIDFANTFLKSNTNKVLKVKTFECMFTIEEKKWAIMRGISGPPTMEDKANRQDSIPTTNKLQLLYLKPFWNKFLNTPNVNWVLIIVNLLGYNGQKYTFIIGYWILYDLLLSHFWYDSVMMMHHTFGKSFQHLSWCTLESVSTTTTQKQVVTGWHTTCLRSRTVDICLRKGKRRKSVCNILNS